MRLKNLIAIVFVFVFMLQIISSEMLTSDAGVSYDSNLVNIFNDQSFADKIVNESGNRIIKNINNETFVRVIVRLNEQSALTEITNDEGVLFSSNLSDGFVGEISEEGLEKLINNSDVENIQIDSVGTTSLSEGDNETSLIEGNNNLGNNSFYPDIEKNTSNLYFYWILFGIFVIILLIVIIKIIKRKNAD